MTYKKTGEALRDEHAVVGGIALKKVAVFDNAGNQITNFGGSAGATVSIGSSATIFAVVNTAAAGQASVVLDTGSRFIGLATVNIGSSNATLFAVVNTGAVGQASIVLDSGANYFGLATVDIGTNNAVALRGNVTISDSKGFIGLTTVVQASTARTITGNLTLSDPKTYIGLTTTTLGASPAYIGLASVNIGGTLPPLSTGANFIGIATVVQSSTARTITGNITLSNSKGFIGLATTVTGAGDRFIGLVTAVTRNAGTNKTLIGIPVALSTASQATIAVPATNLSIYVTSVLLNSDATVRMSIKSGVTYLTGNASIGITLNPGGGWVETGSPDAPVYISTPSASINLEKFDMTGTKANVGGKLVYFTE